MFRIVLSIRRSSNGALTHFTVRSSLSTSPNNGIRRSICRRGRTREYRKRERERKQTRAISPRLNNFGLSWRERGINLLLSSPRFRNPNRPAQRDSIKFGKGQEVLTHSPGKIGNPNIQAGASLCRSRERLEISRLFLVGTNSTFFMRKSRAIFVSTKVPYFSEEQI